MNRYSLNGNSIDFFSDYDPLESIDDDSSQKCSGQSVFIAASRRRTGSATTPAATAIDGIISSVVSCVPEGALCVDSEENFLGLTPFKNNLLPIERAKAVCRICIVQEQCLEIGRQQADKKVNPYAIYGGMFLKDI